MERKYNFIYTTLVEDENDFVGQLAYCLYKREKIKHIETFQANHPDDDLEVELIRYYENSSNPRLLQAYKRDAEDLLQDFVNEIVDEAGNEMLHEMEISQTERLKNIIAPIIPPTGKKVFWTGVLQNLISTIGFALFIGIVILIIYTSKVGFTQAMETLFDVKIIKENPINSPVR